MVNRRIDAVIHTVLAQQGVQLAVGGAGTVVAVHTVMTADKIQGHLSAFYNSFAVCEDLHAFTNESGAGGHQLIAARHFHYTDAAKTVGKGIFQIAKSGDMYSIGAGGGKNRRARFDGNLNSVDFDVSHDFRLLPV